MDFASKSCRYKWLIRPFIHRNAVASLDWIGKSAPSPTAVKLLVSGLVRDSAHTHTYIKHTHTQTHAQKRSADERMHKQKNTHARRRKEGRKERKAGRKERQGKKGRKEGRKEGRKAGRTKDAERTNHLTNRAGRQTSKTIAETTHRHNHLTDADTPGRIHDVLCGKASFAGGNVLLGPGAAIRLCARCLDA